MINRAYKILSDKVARIDYDIEMGFSVESTQSRRLRHRTLKEQARRERELMVETAHRSRQIEQSVKVWKNTGESSRGAGLIITSAKFGVLYNAQEANEELERINNTKPHHKDH